MAIGASEQGGRDAGRGRAAGASGLSWRHLGGLLVVLVLVAASAVALGRTAQVDGPGPERSIFDDDGNLALPMPTLAGPIEVVGNDDGSSQLTFSVEYTVAHPVSSSPGAASSSTSTTADAKADASVVTVGVFEAMANAGPIRLTPAFQQSTLDRQLDEEVTTRDYSIRISPNATTYLRSQGFGSGDAAAEAAALRHVDIDVQQMRDFKVVDGEWDWQQGRAWTGADQPVSGADITDDSTITVTNGTEDGVYENFGTNDESKESSGFLVDSTDAYSSYLSLSGAPVECIDQGDGSNPQGFSSLNGWDIEEGLPPGVVPPGASVTQQVNANDGLGTESLDTVQDWATVSTQVTLASFGLTTPGAKSAITTGIQVALDMAEFSDPVTAALAVPLKAIAQLGDAIYDDMTDSCASFANVFNLTAAEPFGAIASVSWGDQTNGLQQVYDSASFKGSAVTDNVALAQSNGIVSFVDQGRPTTVHPWLAQGATTACGTGDPVQCPGSGNNVIDVVWASQEPCPFSPASDCLPTPSETAALPPIDIPGTSLCGPSNSLCTSVAAPNPSAQEYSTALLSDTSYQVVGEYQPDTSVTGLAAIDDQSVYGGGSDGGLYRFLVNPADPTSNAAAPVASFGSGITTVTALEGDLLVTLSDGELWRYDPDSGPTPLEATEGSVVRAVETGGLVYLATADSMYAVTSGFQLQTVAVDWGAVGNAAVTSMAAGADYLFVGFQSGWVMRCALTACPSTWSELHDGGFDSDANALTAVGDTVYVGLDNGATAQIDGESGWTTVLSQPGDQGLDWGGMVTVDGNVFAGGCVGLQSPVSGDLLGVVVLDRTSTVDGMTVGDFTPQAPYPNSCQNPTSSTTQYKGFDPSTYAMLATPATDGHPPLVFASFTISSGSFVYALESVAAFTGELCLADDGPCPTATEIPVVSSGAPAPAGSLAALGAPQMVSTCGSVPDSAYAAGSEESPLSVGGHAVTDGFSLTPITSSSSSCTTAFAWNLSNLGALPYVFWQGNAYTDDDGTALGFVGSGQAALDASAGGTVLTADDASALTSEGTQLSVDTTGTGALVLSVQTDPGASSGPVVVTDDVLTSSGQPIPSPSPLLGASTGSTCRTADPTLASTAAALYPLDGSTNVAVDVSGNQNNGAVSSPAGYDATPGPSAACPDNGALAFDGASTTVTLPTTLDPAVEGSAVTVVASVLLDDVIQGNPRVVANAHTDQSGVGLELALQGGAGPMFSVGLPTGPTTASGSVPLTTGAWHQVVGVYDGAAATVYVDGVSVARADTPGSGASIVASPLALALGYDPAYDGDFFDGEMADVAVVPQALSAGQVAGLWSQLSTGSPTSPTTTTTAPRSPTTSPSSSSTSTSAPSSTSTAPPPSTTTTVVPTCAFVNASMAGQADAVWLLADRGPTAADSSGHGNDATIANAAAYDQAPGPATGCAGSGGLQFDGASTFVTAPASLDPSLDGDQLTVVSFFQTGSGLAGQPTVVANDQPTVSGDGFALSLATDGGSVAGGTFQVGAAGGVATAQWTATVPPGTWHQYVGTYDGATATAYLDGQVVASTATSGAVAPGAEQVAIGYDPVARGSFFQGLLADVGIGDVALTSQQVSGMWVASQRYANAPTTAGIGSSSGPGPLVWLVPLVGLGLAVMVRRPPRGVSRR